MAWPGNSGKDELCHCLSFWYGIFVGFYVSIKATQSIILSSIENGSMKHARTSVMVHATAVAVAVKPYEHQSYRSGLVRSFTTRIGR